MHSSRSILTFLVLGCGLGIGRPSLAATGGQWLHPLPQGNNLNDVVFLDANTAIAVGEQSTVMVTHDGGSTWSVTKLPADNVVLLPIASFNAVARVDALTAIVGGRFGGYYRTTDGGTTWSFVPDTATWAVAFNGTLGVSALGNTLLDSSRMRRSIDGGLTWTAANELTRVYAVDVVSSSLIVGAGEGFVISSDAGLTWTSLPFDSPNPPNAISFLDAMNGAVTAANDRVYVTGDGGVTWNEQLLDPVAPGAVVAANDVIMLDSQTLLVAAGNIGGSTTAGQFLRSSDGGATWDSEFGSRVFRGLARSTSGRVLLVGDGGIISRWTTPETLTQVAGSQLAATDDGGRSAFLDHDHGIIVGNHRSVLLATASTTVMRTNDGGDTWMSTSIAAAHLTDVAATSSGAYAVGAKVEGGVESNALLKSTDGGTTWTTLWSTPASYSYSTSRELKAIAFGSPTHGIAVGARGSYLVIDNDVVVSGAMGAPTSSNIFSDVAMADASTAVAVGRTGDFYQIIRSTDGGSTWSYISDPGVFHDALYAVAFASSQVCVAAGEHTMYRSEDAGATWAVANIDDDQIAPFSAADIAFSSPAHGIAVGKAANGGIFETFDGGQNWSFVDMPTYSTLRGVACFGPSDAIVSGTGLEVLEYSQQPVPTFVSFFDAKAEPFAAALSWSVRDGSTPASFDVIRRVGGETRYVAEGLAAGARAYRDNSVAAGATYEYTLQVHDTDGSTAVSPPVRVTIPTAALELLPNQPNPFNPSTTIRFVLPERGAVRLTVYDVAGRRVTTLVDEVRAAGVQSVTWNGLDARGEPVASGVYVARLESGSRSAIRKMMLLK